jgi:hypothetical protein
MLENAQVQLLKVNSKIKFKKGLPNQAAFFLVQVNQVPVCANRTKEFLILMQLYSGVTLVAFKLFILNNTLLYPNVLH